MSYSKMYDSLRRDSLDFCADMLESFHRTGRRPRPCPPDDDDEDCSYAGYRHSTCDPGGDFLYRMVKLQASHLSHLAGLGFAHADYARRAMEALYGAHRTSRGAGFDPCACEWMLEGDAGSTVSKKMIVANPDKKKANLSLRCSPFRRCGSDDEIDVAPSFTVDGHPNGADVAGNDDAVVKMTLKLDKSFKAGRHYWATVKVRWDDEVAEKFRVHVSVD